MKAFDLLADALGEAGKGDAILVGPDGEVELYGPGEYVPCMAGYRVPERLPEKAGD